MVLSKSCSDRGSVDSTKHSTLANLIDDFWVVIGLKIGNQSARGDRWSERKFLDLSWKVNTLDHIYLLNFHIRCSLTDIQDTSGELATSACKALALHVLVDGTAIQICQSTPYIATFMSLPTELRPQIYRAIFISKPRESRMGVRVSGPVTTGHRVW